MAWRAKYLVAAKPGERIEKRQPGKTARYRVVWRNPDGSKQSKGGFSLAKDADAFALEVASTGHYPDEETFGKFFEGWQERYKHTVRPSSYKRRMRTKKSLEDLWDLPFDQITPALVEDIVMTIFVESPREAQVVLQTIKMVIRNAAVRGPQINAQVLQTHPPVYDSRKEIDASRMAPPGSARREPHDQAPPELR